MSLYWNYQKSCTRLHIGIGDVLTGEASRLAMSINYFNMTKSNTSLRGFSWGSLRGKQPWLVRMQETQGTQQEVEDQDQDQTQSRSTVTEVNYNCVA